MADERCPIFASQNVFLVSAKRNRLFPGLVHSPSGFKGRLSLTSNCLELSNVQFSVHQTSPGPVAATVDANVAADADAAMTLVNGKVAVVVAVAVVTNNHQNIDERDFKPASVARKFESEDAKITLR